MSLSFIPRYLWLQRSMVGLIFLSFLVTTGVGSVFASTDTVLSPHNTLSGTVTVSGTNTPVSDGRVVAWQDAQHAGQNMAADGSYHLALAGGDWQVTVAPAMVGMTSPAWVYTAGSQAVHFDGNPDPAGPQTLNLIVTPATASINGSLLAPGGGTNFNTPERAWVRAENQEGLGNSVEVDPVTGQFSIAVLPGDIHMSFVLEDPLWASPVTLAGSIWYLADGQTLNAGAFQLVTKTASITGTVINEADQPVAGIPVRAWRLDGSETAQTLSGVDGSYTLPVVNGVWQIRAVPDPNSPYVTAETPQLASLVLVDHIAKILHVATVDVTVQGSLVLQNGTPVAGLQGHVFATYHSGVQWLQFGPGAIISNSQFTLKLSSHVATQYRMWVSFPAQVGYTAIADVAVNLNPGDTTKTMIIPVMADNSTISGHFNRLATGQPVTNIPGIVYAATASGALAKDRLNPLDGSYTLDVASTDTSGHGGSLWWLHAYVDPTTGYIVDRPSTEKVFLPYNNGSGADVTVNFTLAAIDARINGKVTDPSGTAVAGVLVRATDLNVFSGGAFTRWVLTNASGNYAIPVPAGTYKITANFRNWISPLPATITVASQGVAQADLQFRARNAILSGQVTYHGSPSTAFIRAYSDSGAHVVGSAGPNGSYSLFVNAGDTWHVQAVSEDESTFLKSDRVSVTTVVGANPGVDLALEASDVLPASMVFTFDASQGQTVTLSNGAQVIIPAGAMAESGNVTLFVRPLVELADDGGTQPVSFGYRLLAFDASNMPIDHFNSQVTLSMPFTAAQLLTLGVTPDQLIPSYWDVATGTWKPVPFYSVQLNPDGSGSLNLAVDHFTDYALLNALQSHFSYLPILSR